MLLISHFAFFPIHTSNDIFKHTSNGHKKYKSITCQKLIFASSNENEARTLPSGENARALIDDECAGISWHREERNS